jgi:hypothetical protein
LASVFILVPPFQHCRSEHGDKSYLYGQAAPADPGVQNTFMAINQNHLFDELNGVKCAIVEKNVAPGRVDFLRRVLEYNGFTVVVVASPPPKAAAAPPAPAPAPAPEPAPGPAALPPPPETFTVGVTDVMFNAVNAVFGRLLKMPGGHIVTLAYWQQQENQPSDEKPYFDER